MKFKIVNGKLFDPTQNLNGEKKDIFVENGKIVDPNISDIYKFKKSYDVNGMIVMAGAIDIHSHIAGGNVNNARLLSPEIHSNFVKNNLKGKKPFLVLILNGHLRGQVTDMLKWVLRQLWNQLCFLLTLF